MKRLYCLIILLTALGLGAAEAQSPRIPSVVRGKHVYTIPPGFDPPLIGRGGVAYIESAARKLHFPYYVVLAQQIDGETDEDAGRFIDAIAHKWQQQPGFDSAKASIFLLTYSPRKYRFLAGSHWENQLGFGPSQHGPYNAIFESYVRSSRKDPGTGIVKMMQAVDRHLFVESDPKTLAARREARRKAEIARREAEQKALEASQLQSARDELVLEANRLNELMTNDRKYLPRDMAKFESASWNAELALQSSNRDKMLAVAAGLRLKNEELSRGIEARRSEENARRMRETGRVAAWALGIIVLVCLIMSRALKYVTLKRKFADESGAWETKILNAQPKYLAFDSEREMIAGLKQLTGRTKEVYESTTREVDDIFISIGAMTNHIDACKALAKQGSFLLIGPLKRAITELESEFTIGTNQLDAMDLFAPETRQVTVKPSEIMQQLEERYRTTIEQWDHLKRAAEIRYMQAEQVFSQTKLDELLKTADAYAIPHKWLADHPLFGDTESDQTLYAQVNEGRMNDPVAFLERLEQLQGKEAEVSDRVMRLVKSIEIVRSAHVDSVPDLSMTVLQPQDDPHVSFDSARREEARFTAFLTSRELVGEVEEQATLVQNLYRQCVEQSALAQAAIAAAEQDVEQARKMLTEAADSSTECEAMVREREPIYADMQDARNSLTNGRRYVEAGEKALGSATALLEDRRHLDSQISSRLAQQQLGAAKLEFDMCRQHCNELDEAKRQFEQRLAELDERRGYFETRMRRYGGSVSRLGDFRYDRVGSAMDYVLLLHQLDALESSWEGEVRSARVAYDEEERSRSFGSSSGSSWGGSSSSSSSSGGSWSSGSSSSSRSSSSSSSSSSSGGSW